MLPDFETQQQAMQDQFRKNASQLMEHLNENAREVRLMAYVAMAISAVVALGIVGGIVTAVVVLVK